MSSGLFWNHIRTSGRGAVERVMCVQFWKCTLEVANKIGRLLSMNDTILNGFCG